MTLLDKKLTINEIFYSIQGESYLTGLPCIFVRLTGCHQRCCYCDTEYAFYEGQKKSLTSIIDEIQKFPCSSVLLTGGEPLLQENCGVLAQALLDRHYRVAVETGGARDIRVLPNSVIKIMDLKTPASGEEKKNLYSNLEYLKAQDEVKFVLMNDSDLQWALKMVDKYSIDQLCHVSFSPTERDFLPVVAEAILKSERLIRLQVQFHKIIWPEQKRGY